jgi:hypothetical protein
MKLFEQVFEKSGMQGQLKKLAEECCECGAEALKYADYNRTGRDIKYLLTELVDLEILINQFKLVINEKDWEREYERKVERLQWKLENNKL